MVHPRVLLPILVVALGLPVAARQNPPAQPDGQRPVFRAGAHYVRVDAYPTGKDGRIIEDDGGRRRHRQRVELIVTSGPLRERKLTPVRIQ